MYASRPRPTGAVSGLFLVGYGTFRFIAEYAREPDASWATSRAASHDGAVAVAADDRASAFAMMVWAYRRAAKAQPTVIDRMK